MADEAGVRAELRGFFQERLGEFDLQDDDEIFEMGFVSSLFALEIVIFIEKRYEMTLEKEELTRPNFATLNALSAMTVRQLARQQRLSA